MAAVGGREQEPAHRPPTWQQEVTLITQHLDLNLSPRADSTKTQHSSSKQRWLAAWLDDSRTCARTNKRIEEAYQTCKRGPRIAEGGARADSHRSHTLQ